MLSLGTKLALFNLLSKLAFTAAFLIFLPKIVERINIIQTDDELIKKREQVIDIISEVGIEPFITGDTFTVFGSYNILKEEFVSLEKVNLDEDWNFIEISERVIDNETIEYRVLNYSFRIDGEMYLLEIGKSLVSIEYTRQNIRKVILIFLITFILITISADLFYNRRVVYPLKLIRNKLKLTSSPALYDKKPVDTSTSDFILLDQTITELMNKIDELFLKEKEITVNISHELITPVSVLRSKLENMLLKNDLDHDLAVKIEDSLKTLHRLKSLINSLLLVARIESQQFLKDDTFSLTALLREIKNELDPIATDKGISLSEEHDADYVMAKANRPLIFSMIYNVVNNAIKNTEFPGGVKIISTINYDICKVTISDRGSGINEEQMKTLFSRFKRKLDPEKENTGIGLAITKSIADFHKIDIKVSSEPGKGTDFSFIFPENS